MWLLRSIIIQSSVDYNISVYVDSVSKVFHVHFVCPQLLKIVDDFKGIQ